MYLLHISFILHTSHYSVTYQTVFVLSPLLHVLSALQSSFHIVSPPNHSIISLALDNSPFETLIYFPCLPLSHWFAQRPGTLFPLPTTFTLNVLRSPEEGGKREH
jgi:hypothetical protein